MSTAEWLFWGCAALTVYAYAGYPALLWIWIRLRRRGEVDGPAHEAAVSHPPVSLIIPAYNEEAVIAEKIRNSLDLEYPAARLEIVVVSDGSSDATEEVARRAAGDRVKLVFREDRQGKTACLNAVLGELSGDLFVYTDANAFFHPDALQRLVAPFADARVGCVMGMLEYRRSGSLNAALGEGLYWRYENFLKDLESRLGSTIVGNGAIYAMRRRLCRELPLDAEADVANPLLALRAGCRVVFERRARCWERAAESVREEFGRKTRIITNQIATYLHAPGGPSPLPAGAVFQILSHKVVRWLVPLALAGMLLASAAVHSKLLGAALVAQAVFYALAGIGALLEASGRRVPRAFFVPYYFCAVNAASVKGMLDFARGRRSVVWEKAPSTRLASGNEKSHE
jgi:GT2 family glycosyltransferase